MIYASSSSVYGDTKNKKVDKPISMYAITKKSMELISTLYSTNNKMKIFGVRFFTVYGSYSRPDMSLYKFAKNISTGKPICDNALSNLLSACFNLFFLTVCATIAFT